MEECCNNISKSIKRIDVPDKIAGKAKYIADYRLKDMLYAKTFRSTEARAKILSVKYPELPEGYYIVDKNDVPCMNRVKVIIDDEPFFAEDVVNYIGEPIALVVGPDKKEIMNIMSKIKVEYEKMEAISSIENGINPKIPIFGEDNCFADYKFTKGDINEAIKNSKYTIEDVYETGYQEQFYLEPQGIIGEYNEKEGKVTVTGSMQCPYYVKGSVVQCLGFPEDKVQIIQSITGGAFGGKEDFPSLTGGQVACAAIKTKKPVQLVLERDEDLEVTTKRHPSKIKIKTYIDKDYNVVGAEVDVKLDCGAYATLSNVVLQRAMFASAGSYRIPHMVVTGRNVVTNTVVNGAYRGFGAPQAIYAIEMHMEHVAKKLGLDPMEFKMKNLIVQGDTTATGGIFRDPIILPQMIERAMKMSSFKEKRERFKEEKKQGKLQGMGLSIFFHGGGFTGSGERDQIKALVKLVKDEEGYVEILISNVEMGQGAQTVLRKIVAEVLNIPVEKIVYKNPDTDRVPNSGPTAASRTTVIIGKLLKDAAEDLKNKWVENEKIEVSARYKHPEELEWDGDNFIGDAYGSYSWGINVVEVELDPLTYAPTIKDVWAVYDIGKSMDDRLVRGQIDGGILQGLGYGRMEVMERNGCKLIQKTSTDYTVPTSKDAPMIYSELMNIPYKNGPFGAKAMGELTLVGSAPAYALAIEDALDIDINNIPIRPEYLMEVLDDDK